MPRANKRGGELPGADRAAGHDRHDRRADRAAGIDAAAAQQVEEQLRVAPESRDTLRLGH